MISFFGKHKGTSGVISILLVLMLLPLYSLIAVLVESARIHEAREQLDELTYLGEMAVLADYLDYLNENYDIYAFDGTTAEQSFKDYLQSAESNGGVDTRKLNTLFGIDLQYCSVEYMYSLADTSVLRYQIVQSGRYSMPVEVLSGLTLSSILSVLDEKLKKVQKLFQRVEKTTEAVSGLVGLVTAGLNASTAIKNLETSRAEYVKAYSGFNSVKADFTTKLKSLINSYSDSQFETYYNMIYGNGDKTVNLSLVDDDRAFLDAFLSFADSIDTAYFFKDQNGNNLPEIVLSDEQAEWLDIMEIKNGDDAFKSEDKLVISNITERLFLKINSKTSLYKSRYNIDNPVVKWDTRSELEQTIKDLKLYPNKLETYKTVAGKFANVMNSAAM